jgi:diguanylate cyclase (GGDEF)-like protein
MRDAEPTKAHALNAARQRTHGRTTMLLAGALGALAQGIGVLYVLATWSEPRRSLMLAMFGAGVVVGALTLVAARTGLVDSRWRRPFMLAVTVAHIGALAVAASADGGGSSPAALGFVAPMVLVSVTAPPRTAVPLGAVTIAAYLVVALTGAPAPPGYVLVYVTGLVVVGAACILQARALANQRRQLDQLARTDELTRALNRRGFEERFGRELARARGEGAPLTLVLIDLDGFKAINDRLGHGGGDDVLRWAAGALHDFLRPGDILGRLGGDEFAVLAPGVPANGATRLAERLTLVLGARIPASAGAACYPDEATRREDLVRVADQRLYKVKRSRHASAPVGVPDPQA